MSLTGAAGAALPAMIEDLRGYVEIETPSDDRPALEKGRSWLDGLVGDRLGPAASSSLVPGCRYCDVRVLEYDGAGGSTAPPVLLLAHYDTGWPLGTLDTMPFAVDGDRITGPGGFDMKAGLVQALWAVRLARVEGLALPPLRLLLTGDEEIGSPVSRPVIERAAERRRAPARAERTPEIAGEVRRGEIHRLGRREPPRGDQRRDQRGVGEPGDAVADQRRRQARQRRRQDAAAARRAGRARRRGRHRTAQNRKTPLPVVCVSNVR